MGLFEKRGLLVFLAAFWILLGISIAVYGGASTEAGRLALRWCWGLGGIFTLLGFIAYRKR